MDENELQEKQTIKKSIVFLQTFTRKTQQNQTEPKKRNPSDQNRKSQKFMIQTKVHPPQDLKKVLKKNMGIWTVLTMVRSPQGNLDQAGGLQIRSIATAGELAMATAARIWSASSGSNVTLLANKKNYLTARCTPLLPQLVLDMTDATQGAPPGVVWTSLGPLHRWVPGPTTRWAPGTTRLALHGT
jgi:hypothetical protein